jgi:predicted HTH transcriptional regulator
MTTDELEALLEGADETESLEFKGPMKWNKNSLVKDILAMSNLQDGGRIVFGVEDETYARIGLSEGEITSFNLDTMKDQVAEYADPYVSFRKEIAIDRQGKKYVILTIGSFDELPVICKKDGPDLQKGTVYFRSKTQKPQSARVSNSNDMREIIEVAAVRRMQRLRRIGLVAEKTDEYDFKKELGGL